MALKSDLENGKNYYLISHNNWIKLFSGFGGAPEIPFFFYNVEEKVEKPGGEITLQKVKVHDFNPIKIRTYIAHQGGHEFMAD